MAKNSQQEHKLVISALDKTQATFKSLKSNLGSVAGSVTSLQGTLGGLGIALTATSFVSLVKGTMDSIAALKDLQEQTGLTAESVSAISFATKGNTEGFAKGLTELSKTALAAKNGSEEARKEFQALGVEFQNNNGSLRSAEELFSDVAGALAKMPAGLEKNAVVVKTLGKNFIEYMDILERGQDVFKILEEENRKFGVVLTQDILDAADKFSKESAKLGSTLQSSSQIYAASLAPGLSVLSTALKDVVQEQANLQTKNGELNANSTEWAERLVSVLGFVLNAFAGVKRVVSTIGKAIGTAAGDIVSFVNIGYDGITSLTAASVKFLKGDFKGAGEIVSDLSKRTGAAFKDIRDQAEEFQKDTARVFAEDLPGDALQRSFDRAKKLQNDQFKSNADMKQGLLSAEETFKDRMLGIQKELTRGFQQQIATQIRELDKLKAKLDAARKRKEGVSEEFGAARDELRFGSVQGISENPDAEIRNALAAAENARSNGKLELADKEAKKVIALLQDAKKTAATTGVTLAREEADFTEAMRDISLEFLNLGAGTDLMGASSSDADIQARITELQKQYSEAGKKRDAARQGSNGLLGARDIETYLDQAESLAQQAADDNVSQLEQKVVDINASIDELGAKMKTLAKLSIDFTLDNDKALKDTQGMMTLLNAYIAKNPLVITPVIGAALDSADKQAEALVPATLKSFNGGSNLRLPAAATGGTVGSISSEPAATLQPVNLTVPGVGTYAVAGDSDVVAQINRDFQRQRLKAGE